MSDFFRLVLDLLEKLAPARLVWQWEKGAWYVCGRFWRTVGPGLYPIIPGLMDIKTAGVVPDVLVTPLQSITTKDGKALTFSATFTIEIRDLGSAWNKVMAYQETARELASAVLAEKLAEVEPEMLSPEKRGVLVGGCLRRLRTELLPFGLEVSSLRFNNFCFAKIFRLFNDTQIAA